MSLFTALTRFAARQNARRRRIRTFLQISDLPVSLQKDIGFPDADGFSDEIRHVASPRH